MIPALLLTAAILSAGPAEVDSNGLVFRCEVGIIEINSLYDECGRKYLDQAIFWDWTGSGHHVSDWVNLSTRHYEFRCGESGRGRLLFHYNERIVLITSKSFRRTFTQYDPELEDRAIFPEVLRRSVLKSLDYSRMSRDQ